MNYTLYISLIVIILFVSSQGKVKEGYDSLTTCEDQGYPKEFCLNVPVQSSFDNRCRCATGEWGKYESSSKCHCYPFSPFFSQYPAKKKKSF